MCVCACVRACVSAGHFQRCDQTEPVPGSPAALLLERPAVRPHPLREVLQRRVRPQGETLLSTLCSHSVTSDMQELTYIIQESHANTALRVTHIWFYFRQSGSITDSVNLEKVSFLGFRRCAELSKPGSC